MGVRLRMTYRGWQCVRRMDVEWENGTGERQSWSSWTDTLQNSWYKAEKLLPPSATDISVVFQAGGSVNWFGVCKVDRKKKCEWIRDDDRFIPEIFWFRAGRDNAAEDVDVTFELTGPSFGCYVCRAWNAKRAGEAAEWEHWDDDGTRPEPSEVPEVWAAANEVADLSDGDPELFTLIAWERLLAASRALLKVHLRTLEELRGLDAVCTRHWFAANTGNSVSASLSVLSVPLLFLQPVLGVTLAAGSAISAAGTQVIDSVGDRMNFDQLTEKVCLDQCNALVHAELTKEWLHSLDSHAQSVEAAAASPQSSLVNTLPAGARLTKYAVDTAEGGTLIAETATYTRLVADSFSKFRVASGVLAVAAAAISTGVAIHGWSSTNLSQQVLRDKVKELEDGVLSVQCLLCGLSGDLDCAICLEAVAWSDPIKRCSVHKHPFHARCLEEWGDIDQTCPLCRGVVDVEEEPLSFEELARTHLKSMRA